MWRCWAAAWVCNIHQEILVLEAPVQFPFEHINHSRRRIWITSEDFSDFGTFAILVEALHCHEVVIVVNVDNNFSHGNIKDEVCQKTRLATCFLAQNGCTGLVSTVLSTVRLNATVFQFVARGTVALGAHRNTTRLTTSLGTVNLKDGKQNE